MHYIHDKLHANIGYKNLTWPKGSLLGLLFAGYIITFKKVLKNAPSCLLENGYFDITDLQNLETYQKTSQGNNIFPPDDFSIHLFNENFFSND